MGIDEFLELMFAPYGEPGMEQYIEVRALLPKWHKEAGKVIYREWFPANVSKALIQRQIWSLMGKGECEIYFGFLPREQGKGDAKAVSMAAWIYAGIDGEREGVQGARDLLAKAVRWGRLPEPNIIVNSGHGLHCYWTLPEVVMFADLPSRNVYNSICQGIAEAIGLADPAEVKRKRIITAHADAARLPSTPRLPGTVNYKVQAEPVEVCVERADMKLLRWPYDVWKTKIPKSPIEQPRHEYAVGTDRPMPKNLQAILHAPATEGMRHSTWSKFCASARMSGFGEQALIMAGEQFCGLNPGFTRREMQETIKWALRNVQTKE